MCTGYTGCMISNSFRFGLGVTLWESVASLDDHWFRFLLSTAVPVPPFPFKCMTSTLTPK